ncbi:MAG: glycosyltransferase family 87 protein [Chloroflexia bacterium]
MSNRRPGRWLFWIYCAVLLAISLSIWVSLSPELVHFRTFAWDFLILYAGGRMVLDGHGSSLYDLPAQLAYQARLIAPRRVATGSLPFFYPPTILPFLLPFSLGSLSLGYVLWMCFSLLLIAIFLLLAWRYLGIPREHRGDFLLALLAFYPLSNHLVQGQTSLLLLLGFTLAFLLLRRGRDLGAGLALSLGSIKPPLVLPLLLVLLGKRRWWALAGFLLGTALLVSPLLPFLGVSVVWDYARLAFHLLGVRDEYGLFPSSMNNWRALAYRLGGYHGAGNVLWIGLSLLSLGLLAWIWRYPWADHPRRFSRQFCATILLTTLLSPHLYLHDLVLWLLAGALLVGESKRGWWFFLPLSSTAALLNPIWPWAFGPPTVLWSAAVTAVLLSMAWAADPDWPCPPTRAIMPPDEDSVRPTEEGK